MAKDNVQTEEVLNDEVTKEDKEIWLRDWQKIYWSIGPIIFQKLHIFVFVALPLIILALITMAVGLYGFYQVLIVKDMQFIYTVFGSAPVQFLITTVLLIYKHPLIALLIFLAIATPIWGIGYLIMCLLFPKIVLKQTLERELTEDGKSIDKCKNEGYGGLGRMFWVDDPSVFWLPRLADLPDRLMWIIMGAKWKPPEWRNEWIYLKDENGKDTEEIDYSKSRRDIQFIETKMSILNMIIGRYDYDRRLQQRLFHKNTRSGLFTVVVEMGESLQKINYHTIQEVDYHTASISYDISHYKERTLTILEGTENTMDKATALNKVVAFTERMDRVIRKKSASDKAQEKDTLLSEKNLTDTLKELESMERKGIL